MSPSPLPARRPRPPRSLRRGLLVLALPITALAAVPAPAHAALTAPAAGVVEGNVAINESGSANTCIARDNSSSRLTVTRVSDNALVHQASRSGAGSLTTTWPTAGLPRGDYRIASFTRNSVRSGFGNLGCTTQGEVAQTPRVVTLDNKATAVVTLPASVVTGEDLTIAVSTIASSPGIAGTVVPDQPVTLAVPGAGEVEVTTDAAGRATATLDLPDLPAGPLSVTATVGTSNRYSPGPAGTATTTLTKRTTQVFYRGDSRGEPGERARLEAVLVDVTPGSDRFGLPVEDEPVTLAFGADAADVTTDAAGVVTRRVPLSDPSRLVEVRADYAGDDVRRPSSDTVSFFVGDDAAARPAFQSGLIGSTVGFLAGVLNAAITTAASGLDPVFGLAGVSAVTDLVGAQQLLSTLTGSATTILSGTGDVADGVVSAVVANVAGSTPLAPLVDVAGFEWRSIVVAPDGTRRARTFASVVGVPQPLDVTGDGRSDVTAELTLAELSPSAVVPRLRISRIDSREAVLPLSLQAVLTIPGSTDSFRLGYDTRLSDAPRDFVGDIVIGDGGVGLKVSSRGRSALSVTGAITPGGATGTNDGSEQRFAVGYSTAPTSSSIGIDLGEGSDIGVSLNADRPTVVDLSLVQDTGGPEVFVAQGRIDSVDGDLDLALSGDQAEGLSAELTSDQGLASIDLTARSVVEGRTEQDIRLALTDVPDTIAFGLDAAGQGSLTASGPIGVFEAGYATGRSILTLDDAAYLRLLEEGETSSVALRLPGFEGLRLRTGDEIGIGLTLAPTPLRALVEQDGLQFDARISDAPRDLDLALGADGSLRVAGSDPIQEITVDGYAEDGIFDGATDLSLRLVDVPSLLEVAVADDVVRFGTGGDQIGLLEIFADNGTRLAVPGGGDGLVLQQSPTSTALAARVSGLRTIEASLGSAPEILLDTTAGSVFRIAIAEIDEAGATTSQVNATLDHLVPNLRLRLVEDASGSTRLVYTADEPTNSLTFDFGGLSGSIAGPLPTRLEVCMAGDEACLPDLGVDDPGLGTVRFLASEPTTLNLVDPASGLTVQNLRLRALDLTGNFGGSGGRIYLNTTEFGGECGDAGCVRPIEGGRIVTELDGTRLTFEPGNGFFATKAFTDMEVTETLGVPTGLRGTGGTGVVNCVPATKLEVRAEFIGIPVTLNVRNALCNVTRTN
ncbi:hypothetical protein [Nocardioides sp.]|uniref:hypothetical protein n=1 Tax=Nocardioides sp. TaxID=35761 RepID=UPI0035144FBC